jgi:hypothetical protein
MEINFFPKWLLAKLKIGEERQRHLALSLSAVLVLLLVPTVVRLPHFCLARFLFGIPCPGCGILHSLVAMLNFNVRAAWLSNPAGIGLFLLLFFQIVAHPIALNWPNTSKAVANCSRYVGTAVTVWLLLVWITRLTTGGLHGIRFLPEM